MQTREQTWELEQSRMGTSWRLTGYRGEGGRMEEGRLRIWCWEREERARQEGGPLAFLLVPAAQLCGSSHGGRGRERRWSASGLRLSDECDKDRGVRC